MTTLMKNYTKVICINGQQEMSEQGLDSFIDLKNTLLKTL